jgi:Ca2+/Na+ antiporter
MKPNRLHLSFLLLIPVFFIMMNGSQTLSIELRLTTMIIAMCFFVLWLWILIHYGSKDEEEEDKPMEVRRF